MYMPPRETGALHPHREPPPMHTAHVTDTLAALFAELVDGAATPPSYMLARISKMGVLPDPLLVERRTPASHRRASIGSD